MHYMRVTLDDKLFGHFDAAKFGDATNIVTTQVNQHQMLGKLFRIIPQLGLKCAIMLRRFAPLAGTGNRPHGDFATLLPHQNFGRCAHYMELAHVEIKHIRRRVD